MFRTSNSIKTIILYALCASNVCFGKDSLMGNTSQKEIKFAIKGSYRAPFDASAVLTTRAAFNHAVLGSLLTLEPSYTLEPYLIKDWNWDYSNLRYTIKLRKGLKFHSGHALTSREVEYGIVRWFLLKEKHVLAHHIRNIQGSQKLDGSMTFKSGMLDGLKIIDDYTLSIRLKNPDTAFMYTLSYPDFAPVRPEDIAEDNKTWIGKPNGCGDFKVIKLYEDRLFLRRERNQGGGNLEYIEYLYNEDQLDESDILISDLVDLKKFESKSLSLFNEAIDWGFFLAPNLQKPKMQSASFRNAISSAIDRDAIGLLSPAVSPLAMLLPRNFWGHHVNVSFKPNIQKSLEYLEKVDTEVVKQKLIISVKNSDRNSFRGAVGDILKKSLLKIGIKSSIIPYRTPEADLTLWGLGVGDILDPLSQYSLFMPYSPYKQFILPDEQFRSLFHKAESTRKFDVRVNETRNLALYFNENSLGIPVYGHNSSVWLQKGKNVDVGTQRSSLMFYLDRVSVVE